MASLRLFASVREAAGTNQLEIDASTVGGVIGEAERRFGPDFVAQVQTCRIWLNGEPAVADDVVGPSDEVALLPPVSGG
jgi:molybdopterin converting factor small subunit